MPRQFSDRLRLPGMEPFAGPVEGLMALNRWFVRMRWAAVAAHFAILGIVRWIVRIDLRLDLLAGLGGGLAVYNLLFYWYLEDLEERSSEELTYRAAERFANVQVAADLVALTVLLHFSGGVENPLSTFYVFHVIIASIMLPRGQSYLQALLAITLFTGLALFEYAGLLPHYPLPKYMPIAGGLPQYQNWRFIFGHVGVLVVTLLMSAFFTTSLAKRLRERQAELAKTSSRLARLEQRKSRFMRVAAHQLRAPLSAIRSLLNVALGSYDLDEEKQQELIRRAETRTELMLELLADLLALSRVRDALQGDGERELVPVDETFGEVLGMYRPQSEDKQQELHVELTAGDATVLMESSRLRDVFTNLVSNAVKYTPSGGTVRVSSRADDSSVVCEVSDTGIGIPPEDQEHLFEEFYRASNAKEFAEEGTGLGLSIVREIVESAGGRIVCASGPGEGTCFTVTLPLAACRLEPHRSAGS
jgi:signal transduction histidine kinase